MALILFTSCIEEPTEKFETPQQHPKLAIVKDWFEAHKEELRIDDSGVHFRTESQELILPFFEKEPDWDKFHIYEWPDGRTVYEVNLSNTEIVLLSHLADLIENGKDDHVIQNMIFIENKDKRAFDPAVIRYYSEIESASSKFSEISYVNLPNQWNGQIDIYTYDERHILGYGVENGIPIKVIRYLTEDESSQNSRNIIDDGNTRYYEKCSTIWLPGPCYHHGNFSITCYDTFHEICYLVNLQYNWLGSPDHGGYGNPPLPSIPSFGGGSFYAPPPGINNIPAYFKIIKDPSFTRTVADCIFEKLSSLNSFQKLASKFIGPDTEFDVVLKVGQTADSQANGQAWYRGPNRPIEITLNENRLNTRSALEVARTIVHEMVHAEIFRTLNTANPSPGEIKFQQSFNAYVNMYRGPGDQHHNHMANEWVTTMGSILKDVHRSLDPSGYDKFKSIYYPNGIPNHFYESLAWEGLDKTIAWNLMQKVNAAPPALPMAPRDRIKQDRYNAQSGSKNCINN